MHTPLDSRVSCLDPELIKTVTDAKELFHDSQATVTPLESLSDENGLSYYKASGICPYSSSPKSVKRSFVNYNLSLLTISSADLIVGTVAKYLYTYSYLKSFEPTLRIISKSLLNY